MRRREEEKWGFEERDREERGREEDRRGEEKRGEIGQRGDGG